MEFPEEYFKNISFTAQDFIRRLLQRDAVYVHSFYILTSDGLKKLLMVRFIIPMIFHSSRDRLSVQECLNHPWLNTEELFQRSTIRKSRRSCSSEQNKKRKKLRKLQQQNGLSDGKIFTYNYSTVNYLKLLCQLVISQIKVMCTLDTFPHFFSSYGCCKFCRKSESKNGFSIPSAICPWHED